MGHTESGMIKGPDSLTSRIVFSSTPWSHPVKSVDCMGARGTEFTFRSAPLSLDLAVFASALDRVCLGSVSARAFGAGVYDRLL
jgi:hypothetical protein